MLCVVLCVCMCVFADQWAYMQFLFGYDLLVPIDSSSSSSSMELQQQHALNRASSVGCCSDEVEGNDVGMT